jgi:organic hydroperoxide reductase OsmC/OhrA
MSSLPPFAETISQGGRAGSVETSEEGFNLHFKPPSVTNPQGLTPEHLFGAAWAACFNGAVKYIAKESGHADDGITVEARVQLQPNGPKPGESLSFQLP